jgi:hypothetical protein
MPNAKKQIAPNQKPVAKVSAAQRKRLEKSQQVKDSNAQLSSWAFSLLSFILSACLARIVKAGLMTEEQAATIDLNGDDTRTAWQVLVNPKVASKARVERFEEGEARTKGKVEFGLALAEAKDTRLSGMVSAYKLHEAAWMIIRKHIEPASGDADQAHMNALRVAMLARDEQAEGKENKALATVNREKALRTLVERAIAHAGANPFGDMLKKARVQSGKKCLTINTDSKEFGSLTTRSMTPERAAAVRATGPEFLLGVDHIEALAQSLNVDAKALRDAMTNAGALRLAIKADAEKVETVERKPSKSAVLREHLDKQTSEMLDLLV